MMRFEEISFPRVWILLWCVQAVISGAQAERPSTQPAPGANLVILHGGSRYGQMESCGCAYQNSGGVDREAWFIEQLRGAGTEFLAVEAGGILPPFPDPIRDRLRLEYLYRILHAMSFGAVNVGFAELRIGVDTLRAWEKQIGIPLVSANIVGLDGKPVFKPYLVFPRKDANGDPCVIGVTGVTASKYLLPRDVQAIDGGGMDKAGPSASARTAETSAGATIASHREKLDAILAVMKRECDVTIVLFDGGVYEAEVLARKFQPDIVLTNETAPYPSPKRFGRTFLNVCGVRGKNLGRMDFRFSKKEGLTEVKTTSYVMTKDVPQVAGIRALIDEYKSKVPKYTETADGLGASAVYLGHQSCAPCHKDEYDQWSGTAHAWAYDHLKAAGPSTSLGAGKDADPKELRRAVTGMGEFGGFESVGKTPGLVNVQCEECHGPGRSHENDRRRIEKVQEWQKRFPKGKYDLEPRVKMRKEFDAAFCARCHDDAHNPGFDFNKALEAIAH